MHMAFTYTLSDNFTAVITDNDQEFIGDFWYSTVIAGFLGGEVYVVRNKDDAVVGAAVWFPPGREMYDS
jgi:hypothetical protein